MVFDKSEALKECKNLLRLINCEAVIDTKDQTLYDMLFKSEIKKKMLLSWLIQQLYSPESCANYTFEDLISVFIPKQNLNKFFSGSLPVIEQYKRWRFIMLTVYRRQKGKIHNKPEVSCEIQNGIMLDKYEELWNEKLGSNFNYIGLVTGKQKKSDASEIQLEVEKIKTKLVEFYSVSESSLKNPVTSSDCQLRFVLKKFKNYNDKVTEVMSNNYMLWITNINRLDDSILKYSYFNQFLITELLRNLHILHENTGMFDKLTSGVENLQPLRGTSDVLYEN